MNVWTVVAHSQATANRAAGRPKEGKQNKTWQINRGCNTLAGFTLTMHYNQISQYNGSYLNKIDNGLRSGASICRNLWGFQLNNQNFFDKISRILFALLMFIHRRLCLQCSYFAIAHLMQFCFFLVLSRLGNKRTVFSKKKEKKLIAAKSGLVEIKGYLEIYNRVK